MYKNKKNKKPPRELIKYCQKEDLFIGGAFEAEVICTTELCQVFVKDEMHLRRLTMPMAHARPFFIHSRISSTDVGRGTSGMSL